METKIRALNGRVAAAFSDYEKLEDFKADLDNATCLESALRDAYKRYRDEVIRLCEAVCETVKDPGPPDDVGSDPFERDFWELEQRN